LAGGALFAGYQREEAQVEESGASANWVLEKNEMPLLHDVDLPRGQKYIGAYPSMTENEDGGIEKSTMHSYLTRECKA
jgi:hypothetical protein